jgi:hypothetical protein
MDLGDLAKIRQRSEWPVIVSQGLARELRGLHAEFQFALVEFF